MWHTLASAPASLWALNVVVATILMGLIAVTTESLVPRRALPLRHWLLCAALLLIFVSPLSIALCGNRGLGLIPLSTNAPEVPPTQATVASSPGHGGAGGGKGVPLASQPRD